MDKETREAQNLTDFYEEDETPEEIDASIRRSERGVTVGPNRLSPAGQRRVDAAASRYDGLATPWNIETVVITDCWFAPTPN